MLERTPDAFLFMKVGQHAGETFEEILERKNREFAEAGRIFWGYGGTTLHPLRQVQPFINMHLTGEGAIHLLMEPISSRADPDVFPATEFSIDGVDWQPIPRGISVTGSRYALVLGEIVPGELEFPAADFEVAVGPSRGKTADSYLRGHVDKGCFSRTRGGAGEGRRSVRRIGYTAELHEPYAVLLRS